MIQIHERFVDAEAVRAHALSQEFYDYAAHDGEVYKRVWIGEVPGLLDAIERAMMGPVDMLMMGYRLNYAGELPNCAIHSDIGWGTHALVLYLCDGEGGTAFWTHNASNSNVLTPDNFAAVQAECDTPEAFTQWSLCPLQMGRAVIYESALFHSRYPFAAFGDSPETGRLVAVAFFSPKDSA